MIEYPMVLKAGNLKRLHVDQHRIRANVKDGTDIPAITVQGTGGPYKAHEVEILDKDGDVVATMIYRPHDPLSCGARLWIETRGEVRTNIRVLDAVS